MFNTHCQGPNLSIHVAGVYKINNLIYPLIAVTSFTRFAVCLDIIFLTAVK